MTATELTNPRCKWMTCLLLELTNDWDVARWSCKCIWVLVVWPIVHPAVIPPKNWHYWRQYHPLVVPNARYGITVFYTWNVPRKIMIRFRLDNQLYFNYSGRRLEWHPRETLGIWISQEPWQVSQNGFGSPQRDILATSCQNLKT